MCRGWLKGRGIRRDGVKGNGMVRCVVEESGV